MPILACSWHGSSLLPNQPDFRRDNATIRACVSKNTVPLRAHHMLGEHWVECPLLAQSGHALVHCTCPLSGVKQTWPWADVCFCGRYWVKSGHGLVHCICLLMTQSGHLGVSTQPSGSKGRSQLPSMLRYPKMSA